MGEDAEPFIGHEDRDGALPARVASNVHANRFGWDLAKRLRILCLPRSPGVRRLGRIEDRHSLHALNFTGHFRGHSGALAQPRVVALGTVITDGEGGFGAIPTAAR